jgi:hypothetical protein
MTILRIAQSAISNCQPIRISDSFLISLRRPVFLSHPLLAVHFPFHHSP